MSNLSVWASTFNFPCMFLHFLLSLFWNVLQLKCLMANSSKFALATASEKLETARNHLKAGRHTKQKNFSHFTPRKIIFHPILFSFNYGCRRKPHPRVMRSFYHFLHSSCFSFLFPRKLLTRFTKVLSFTSLFRACSGREVFLYFHSRINPKLWFMKFLLHGSGLGALTCFNCCAFWR